MVRVSVYFVLHTVNDSYFYISLDAIIGYLPIREWGKSIGIKVFCLLMEISNWNVSNPIKTYVKVTVIHIVKSCM